MADARCFVNMTGLHVRPGRLETSRMNSLFVRAVLAFLALPGMVAFVIPLWFLAAGDRRIADATGMIPLALGIVLLLWCVREFYITGRGTLAPWAPPRHLVVSGLYRYSRNPMYIAVTNILFGWALLFRSRSLAYYTVLVMLVFVVRVTLFEEPFLARTHGEKWTRYRSEVPRWFGSRRH
jgi:protein-S-isoprenylcysteine O-methyltransferase Ste14